MLESLSCSFTTVKKLGFVRKLPVENDNAVNGLQRGPVIVAT